MKINDNTIIGGLVAIGGLGIVYSMLNPVRANIAKAYATQTGTTWYMANGTSTKMPNSRCDGDSNRWEIVKSGMADKGFEVVAYLNPTKSSMTSDGHIGLKHWGPEHTPPCDYKLNGKCCCWYDTGIRESGIPYVEIERPHPNNMNEKRFASIGRRLDTGQPFGIRWHVSKASNGTRIMGWVDVSGKVNTGQWKSIYNILDTGQVMPKSYKPTKTQNIEIRVSDIPCNKINFVYGPYARKIT